QETWSEPLQVGLRMSLCYMHCVKNSITFFTITTTDASPRKTLMIEFFLLSCCFFLRSLLVLYAILSPHKMRDGNGTYVMRSIINQYAYTILKLRKAGDRSAPLVATCIYLTLH